MASPPASFLRLSAWPVLILTARRRQYRPGESIPREVVHSARLILLRRGTLQSDNSVYIQLALDLGPDEVAQTAKDMGIKSTLKGYPSSKEFLLDLANGRLDAVSDDISVLEAWLASPERSSPPMPACSASATCLICWLRRLCRRRAAY